MPAVAYNLEMRTLRKAGDEVEPNASIPDATPIPAGNDNYMEGTFTQSSGPQDLDVYRLTVPPGPSLSARLELSNLPGSPVERLRRQPDHRRAARPRPAATLLATDTDDREQPAAGWSTAPALAPAFAGAHLLAPGDYTVRVFHQLPPGSGPTR